MYIKTFGFYLSSVCWAAFRSLRLRFYASLPFLVVLWFARIWKGGFGPGRGGVGVGIPLNAALIKWICPTRKETGEHLQSAAVTINLGKFYVIFHWKFMAQELTSVFRYKNVTISSEVFCSALNYPLTIQFRFVNLHKQRQICCRP